MSPFFNIILRSHFCMMICFWELWWSSVLGCMWLVHAKIHFVW